MWLRVRTRYMLIIFSSSSAVVGSNTQSLLCDYVLTVSAASRSSHKSQIENSFAKSFSSPLNTYISTLKQKRRTPRLRWSIFSYPTFAIPALLSLFQLFYFYSNSAIPYSKFALLYSQFPISIPTVLFLLSYSYSNSAILYSSSPIPTPTLLFLFPTCYSYSSSALLFLFPITYSYQANEAAYFYKLNLILKQ